MNAQKVPRSARRTKWLEPSFGGSIRGTDAFRGITLPSGSAYERPDYPDHPGKRVPPLRFAAADDPEPVEGNGCRHDAGWSRETSTGRVLIVEDDADLRETLADILLYEGYRVETAGNGQEGWARLATEPYPALVLLDLMMPVMNGWEFRARQLSDPLVASIPVVLISAAEGIQQQAALLSANSFLAKPIDVSRLIDVVSRFVS